MFFLLSSEMSLWNQRLKFLIGARNSDVIFEAYELRFSEPKTSTQLTEIMENPHLFHCSSKQGSNEIQEIRISKNLR